MEKLLSCRERKTRSFFSFYCIFFLMFLSQRSSVFAKSPSTPDQTLDQIQRQTAIPTPTPAAFTANFKLAIYQESGTVDFNDANIVAFGPGFEKVLNKHKQLYPNLDPNQLTREEIEKKKANLDRMVHMTVPELIKNGGNFHWKKHTVTTEDDYILTIFQIRKRPKCLETLPVLFMHDFLGTAADWLMVDPEDAIPFYLVNLGYEVWLLNARGNEYSNGHQFLKTTDPRYWEFSFHEQGKYDLPAVVKYVKKHTETQLQYRWQKRRVSYVGSGLGTTVFYVYLSLYGKEQAKNIFSLTALTPTAFLSRTTGPLKLFTSLANDYFPFKKDGPLIPQTLANFLHHAVPDLCPFHILRNISLCTSSGFLRGIDASADLTVRVMRRVFGHYPSTTSIRTFLHYIQLVTKPKFKQFNFGPLENFKRYKQLVPLQYNLFNMTVASFNIYGEKDVTVDHRDVERTDAEVGVTAYQAELMAIDPYTNVDFMYGTVGSQFAKFAVIQSIRFAAYKSFVNSSSSYKPNDEFITVKETPPIPKNSTELQIIACSKFCQCKPDPSDRNFDPANFQQFRNKKQLDWDLRKIALWKFVYFDMFLLPMANYGKEQHVQVYKSLESNLLQIPVEL